MFLYNWRVLEGVQQRITSNIFFSNRTRRGSLYPPTETTNTGDWGKRLQSLERGKDYKECPTEKHQDFTEIVVKISRVNGSFFISDYVIYHKT